MSRRELDQFFSTARERYRILVKRDHGVPPPWTTDAIFQDWRFCCVHREDDRTTRWFREEVRSKLAGRQAAEACLIFRWFNRIETGERIKDLLLLDWDREEARRRLTGVSPLVTGAYMVNTSQVPADKLTGILTILDHQLPLVRSMSNEGSLGPSLQAAHSALKQLWHLGPFMAYEVVTDLRWTDVLSGAEDIDTWASAGPGCARGLAWVFEEARIPGRGPLDYNSRGGQEEMLAMMRHLLGMAGDPRHWPSDWPRWEMREVEHWLCEFDKYKRAESGLKLKRRYP